jgi:hypothetical protein
MEGADPELLGAAVLGVVVLAGAFKALGLAEEGPSLGFVGGAAEELAVDEAFEGKDGMALALLPVVAEAVAV